MGLENTHHFSVHLLRPLVEVVRQYQTQLQDPHGVKTVYAIQGYPVFQVVLVLDAQLELGA